LGESERAERCEHCGECEEKCPQGLQIGDLMTMVHEKLKQDG
jgi:predicted aldo/keto reductase-like oxidoreductase